MEKLTAEQMVDLWEDRREIKNLIGRYSYAFFYKQEAALFDNFWSSREDVCLGTNDGWYLGSGSVRAYYDYFVTLNAAADEIKKARFPAQMRGRTPQQMHAMGNMEIKSTSEGVIEVAADKLTAKCAFSYVGNMSQMTPAGPVAYWTNGEYCADLVREQGEWKIWHLQNLEDVHSRMGVKWWGEQPPLEPFAEFAPLGEIRMPEPDVKEVLYELYSPEREFRKMPELPCPYATFSETFSYGYEKGGVGQ